MAPQDEKLVEPLYSTVVFIGGLLLFLMLAIAILAVSGHGASVGGFGDTTVCATQLNTNYGQSTADLAGLPDAAAKPGVDLSVNGTLQGCALNPSFSQRIWYTLTTLPAGLVWSGVLFLLWRLTVVARRFGPFTIQVAARMRLLGWFIIIGGVAAASVQGFATDALLNSMFRGQNTFGDAIPAQVSMAVPVLAAVVLLTFARFVRLGVAMDEEIKGTV
jgi:hypothetical protein